MGKIEQEAYALLNLMARYEVTENITAQLNGALTYGTQRDAVGEVPLLKRLATPQKRSPGCIGRGFCVQIRRAQVKNTGTTTLEISRISAPPRREEICAKGISDMRRAAESTATSPVPPMLAMHSPAVMADSIG